MENVDQKQELNTSNKLILEDVIVNSNKPKYTQAKTLFNIDLDN